MRTKHLFGSLCVSLAMFALPAAAQTPGQTTPATSSICEEAGLADATPGLQGLCVAMCEAQACEAEINPVTGEVDFGPGCEPSSDKLLANYNKLADFDKENPDPPMPCVKVACPCWTEAELENIGDSRDSCIGGEGWTYLSGTAEMGGWEFAYAVDDGDRGLTCTSNESSFNEARFVRPLSTAEFAVCQQTVIKQCASRGFSVP